MQAQTLPTLNITRFSMLFLVPQFLITSENMVQDSMTYYSTKKRLAEVSFFSKTDSEKINKEIISQPQKGEMWRRCTFCILIIMIKWSVKPPETNILQWWTAANLFTSCHTIIFKENFDWRHFSFILFMLQSFVLTWYEEQQKNLALKVP